MIGIVLWCDAAENQAVFWSEGKDSLCYFDGAETARASEQVNIGDVVQFDLSIARNSRRACNVKRLMHSWGQESDSALDALPEDSSQTSDTTAEILPFGHTQPKPQPRPQSWQARKLG